MPDNLYETCTPVTVPGLLQALATEYWQSQADLQDTWQDPNAGKVWGELAKILERASDQAAKAVEKHFK